MTFTSTLPTEPGFYAWKAESHHTPLAIELAEHSDFGFCATSGRRSIGEVSVIAGLWCRLVPADELSSIKEELNNFQKGYAELSDLVQSLKKEKEELTKERDKWKASHDNQVNLRRILMDRPDLKERANLVQKLIEEKEDSFKAGMIRASEIVKDYRSCNIDCSGSLLLDIEQEIQNL